MAVDERAGVATNGAVKQIEVTNPATGEPVGSVPVVSPEAVGEMVARARRAQPAWDALGFEGRAKIMRRAQKWTLDNADRVIATIQSETGKSYEDAHVAEVTYTALAFGFWAKKAPEYLADEKVRSASPLALARKLVVRYRPVGVVGIIGPWNYPLTNSFGDAIPAMMAGNAVVLKPSEVTPLTSLLMEECMRDCGLPENVFGVAPGFGDTGVALIDAVDMIMFTGSTSTGKKVMARAAETLTPVSLELGGKDPMVVLADADLERAANAAVHYSMQNAGQTCVSVERVYVEEAVYDEFTAKVAEKLRGLRVGAPGGPGSVDVGAITFDKQVDVIRSHIEDAKAKGARVAVGGEITTGKGRFVQPTLLLDVDHTMEAMTEETFGPTLPVMKVKDAEEAVRLANDSMFGLSASVFTRDVVKGEQIARRLEAGSVMVNDAQMSYGVLELPMGGWKTSGLGFRHSSGGIRKYCRQQSLVIARLAPRKDAHMLPYSARMTRAWNAFVKLLYGRGKRT